jgi:hypothetical protein
MDSPGFELPVRPSAGVRALRRAVFGLGVAGFLLAAWLARGHEDGWLLVALGALMLWACWRHGRLGLSWGVLRVGSDGRPQWRSDGAAAPGFGSAASSAAPSGEAAAFDGFLPALVERWFAGERLAWLRLRTVDGRRHEILVARSAVDGEVWRRLGSWLAWTRRGSAAS